MRKLILGAALGAAAAWFLDPDSGARRRNVTRDKAASKLRRGAREATTSAQHAANQVKGAAVSAAPGGRPDAGERLNDPALARKVESEIFRDAEAPKGAVSVDVQEGVVYLRGEVEDPQQITRLAEAAREVEGVRDVRNLLHTPGTPAPTT